MAVLSDQDRFDAWAQWQRENKDTVAVTKTDLRAAFNALDDYFNANAAAMNTAIPQPARANLSTSQKASIARLVLYFRFINGA